MIHVESPKFKVQSPKSEVLRTTSDPRQAKKQRQLKVNRYASQLPRGLLKGEEESRVC